MTLPNSLAQIQNRAIVYLYIMAELSEQDIQALVNKMQQVECIETYLHFPEVIAAGPFRLEASELEFLLYERFIEK